MLVVVGEKPLNKFPLALDQLPRILRSLHQYLILVSNVSNGNSVKNFK